MRTFLLILLLLPAALTAQQESHDVAIAPPAITALSKSWSSVNAAYACLYGHIEGSVIVLDSADVQLAVAPDSTICRGPYIGAAGFYRGYVGAEEEVQGLMEVSMVLRKRTDWRIAGIVHGVIPVVQADGTRVIAPLMWRATR